MLEKMGENSADERDYNFCFKTLDKMSISLWMVQSTFPFHAIFNAHSPNFLYLAWKFNNVNYVNSFDISNIGRIFYLPEE